MSERKIVQISAAGYGGDYSGNSVLYALCDDGTVWCCFNRELVQLPAIPQPAASEVQTPSAAGVQVTEAMVEAACDAYTVAIGHATEHREAVRFAITEALTAARERREEGR